MACSRLPTIQAGPCPVAMPQRQSTSRRGASILSVRYPSSSGVRHQAPRAPRALEKDQPDGGDSEALPSDGTAPQTSKAAIMAKLEAAKKYKEAMGGGSSLSSPPSPAPPSVTEPPAATPMTATGSAAATETDDAVLKQQQAEGAPMAPADGAEASEEESSAAKENSDVLAKFLATGEEGRARVESNLLSALQDASDAASAVVAGSDDDDPSKEQKLFRARSQQADVKPTQGDSSGLYARERARASAEFAADVADQEGAEGSSTDAARTGSAQQAAKFLGATLEQQKQRAEGKAATMEEGQSMEGFLLAKEQKVKDQEVEFISVEKNYKPKVSTWGMFPRPENISKAYGGGKTLRPEDLVETDEQKKEREQAVRDRVRAFKMSQGLLIDDSTNEECRKLYETGMMVMKEGRLNEAAELFLQVEEKVVLKSEWGGRSRLQRALCLDSLGRTEEAGQIYKLIRNHPQVDVAKRAKQMIFGISSMDFLKTHSISYGVGKEDYEGYFRRISSEWDTIYLPTSEEDEKSMQWQSAVAILVMATPLLTIAGVVLTK